MTATERWKRVQDLLDLVESAPAGRREDELERAEPDPSIRIDVLRLLQAMRDEEQAQSSAAQRPEVQEPLADWNDDRPDLQLHSLIGAGGAGTVFRGTRLVNGVSQPVAVKIYHSHRSDPADQERFLREQRMLATLTDPGIVRFFDAGVTRDGRPYLVMELAEGEHITKHCDDRMLGVEARLRLLLSVCRAVASAHGRLIVHLDLKPSNILVTPDGDVRLLDFGTARLIDHAEAAVVTQQLTPHYASPERLRGEAATVASDVYSLGLILFELCSGGAPFPHQASVVGMAERAAGHTTSSSLPAAATAESAGRRGVSLDKLRRQLSGDLASICAKALAFAPEARYLTVGDLAADLRRFLDGKPIEAHPPALLYRARKFVGRHTKALAAAAAVLALLTAAGASAWRERSRGSERLEEARAMANYLLFDLYDHVNALPGSTALRAQMAKEAQARLDHLAELSGARNELRLEAARGYSRLAEIQGISGSSSIGQTKEAAKSLAAANAITTQVLTEEPRNRAALLQRAAASLLSAKLNNWNRRDTSAARKAIEQARSDLVASEDRTSARWLDVSAVLALQDADLAEFERDFARERAVADAALQQLKAHEPADPSVDHVLRVVALHRRRGNAAYFQKRWEDALAAYQDAQTELARKRALHPNHPELLYAAMTMLYEIAYVHGERRQPAQMLECSRQSLRIGEKLLQLDADNHALRRSYWNKRQALAESLGGLRRWDEAVPEQAAVLAARRQAVLDQADSNLAKEDVQTSQATLARLLAEQGQRQRSCALARQTMTESEALFRAGGMTPRNWTDQQRLLKGIAARCMGR